MNKLMFPVIQQHIWSINNTPNILQSICSKLLRVAEEEKK